MRKVLELSHLWSDMTGRGCEPGKEKVGYIMNTPDKHKQKQQGGLWTWIVVGLLYSAVLAALYGPFIWERIYSA
jgi:hypothetical protein